MGDQGPALAKLRRNDARGSLCPTHDLPCSDRPARNSNHSAPTRSPQHARQSFPHASQVLRSAVQRHSGTRTQTLTTDRFAAYCNLRLRHGPHPLQRLGTLVQRRALHPHEIVLQDHLGELSTNCQLNYHCIHCRLLRHHSLLLN